VLVLVISPFVVLRWLIPLVPGRIISLLIAMRKVAFIPIVTLAIHGKILAHDSPVLGMVTPILPLWLIRTAGILIAVIVVLRVILLLVVVVRWVFVTVVIVVLVLGWVKIGSTLSLRVLRLVVVIASVLVFLIVFCFFVIRVALWLPFLLRSVLLSFFRLILFRLVLRFIASPAPTASTS
jgi:hypothetical protein